MARALLLLAAVALLALLLAQLVDLLVRLAARGRLARDLWTLRDRCRRPLAALLLLGAEAAAVEQVGLPESVSTPARHVLVVLSVFAAAWLAVRAAFVVEDAAFQRVRIDVADNRRARRQRTQIQLLRRLTAATVIVLACGFALLTLPGLDGAGAGVLASAGVLSVVAGLAAQTSLTNVFAGIQLTFTDALRVDDVIVAEGEWGRVEELTLTYVVLALWDERRLVLPTSYFTTTPFQNWTRTGSRILGQVVLHLDYAVPIEELRAETARVVTSSPLWDGREWVLQVVDSTPHTMVVRVLASSVDAPTNYDLRCEIRERLLGWVHERHPAGLPRLRLQEPSPSGSAW